MVTDQRSETVECSWLHL